MSAAQIQADINAAHAAGGGTVVVPPGQQILHEQIVVRQGVHLTGTGRVGYDYHISQPTFGTIFDPQWGYGPGAAGNPAFAAILMESGSKISNLGFNYTMQVPTLATPIEFGASIQPWDPLRNEYSITIEDIYLGRSYVGIDLAHIAYPRGISNLYIRDIVGCPLHTGLTISRIGDWATIRDIHFNSGFIACNDTPGFRTGLQAWTASNGIAFRLGGNDWAQLLNAQVFGYGVGCRILGGDNYTGEGPYTFQNCQFDACWHGIEIAGPARHSVQILGTKFAPYNFITGLQGCAVSSIGGVIDGIQMIGCYEFGSPLFNMYVDGAVNIIAMANIARTSGSGGPAYVAFNGDNIQVANNISKGFGGGAFVAQNCTDVVNTNNQT